MKKQMLWTASAIMGLSIFAAPVIGQEKPDSNYSVSAAGKIQNLPYVKYDDQTFKKGTVVTYRTEVKHAKIFGRMTSFLKLPKGFEADESFKPVFLVTVKNSKGKVIQKVNFEYGATIRDNYVVARMPIESYTFEIKAVKGIPKEGITLSSMITGGAMGTRVKHKLHSSLGEYFPTGISTIVTTAHRYQSSNSLSGPGDHRYSWMYPYYLPVVDPTNKKERARFEFKQNRPGIYYIRTHIRDETDATHYDMKRFVIFQKATPQSLKVSVPKKVYKPNEKVVMSGSAKGEYLRYKFTYKVKSTTKETTVSDFSKTKQVTFKAPKVKGDYTLTMYTKQLNSNETVRTRKVITVK